MDRGTKLSAIGHGALIAWVALGDFWFAPDVPPPIAAASVSLITDAALKGMEASAPKSDTPDAKPPASKPLAAKPPKPKPAKPAKEVPPEVPVAPEAQPLEAPTPTAPIAADEQPLPVPDSATPAKPRPIDRVAAVPVDDKTDTPEIADTASPEVSDQAAPDAPVVTEEKPAASPQEAAPVIVTEAVDTNTDAPQLAPTSSRRPQSRPEKVADVPADAPADTATDAPAEADAIAAALTEAAADTPTDAPATETSPNSGPDYGAGQDLPTGPPMSGSEVEGLRIAINKCWNVGQLSSEALHTVVTLRVEMSEAGKPTLVEMTGFEGGSEASAQRAFEAGKRAVMRCAGQGYDLDPDKYGQWNVLNLIFDPEGMRLR